MANKTNKTQDYYIIRARGAGVFFGNIKERTGGEITISNARRLWYWSGAASLSQLAVDGVANPNDCKFTVTVEELIVFDALEIIKCTDKAIQSINGTREWKI